MPQAVTHILIPAILMNLFRDYFVRDKRKFPLHYVLIAGLAGILPDFDLAVYYVLGFFGFGLNEIHRTFSHNVFIILFFILLGFIFLKNNFKTFGKHRLKLSTIFFVISFGVFMHLFLDFLIIGEIVPFYPLSNYIIGLDLVSLLPVYWQESIIPVLDAALLIFWLIYIELKHKISNFI